MEQYVKRFKEKNKPEYDREAGENTVNPFRDAQFALARATFVKQERAELFDAAYADILTELFKAWLTSAPHEVKTREYLYSCAMALGTVKSQLINYEKYGKNAAFMNNLKGQDAAEDDNDQN